MLFRRGLPSKASATNDRNELAQTDWNLGRYGSRGAQTRAARARQTTMGSRRGSPEPIAIARGQ